MDDEPMWAADRVVAPTPSFSITIPKTINEFAIKLLKEMLRNCPGRNLSKGNIIKILYHSLTEITQVVLNAAAGVIFLYKTPNQAYQLLEDKFLIKLDWAKNQITKPSLKKIVAFTDEGSSNSDTDKIMDQMDAMTMKMDAQYKEFQSCSKQLNPNDDDIPISREEEAKFMQTFRHTCFYNDYRDHDSNRDNWRSSRRNDYNRDDYQSNSDNKPDLRKQLIDFIKAQHLTNSFVKYTFMDLKKKLEITTKNHLASTQNLEAKFDRFADKQSGRPSGSLPRNTQPNPNIAHLNLIHHCKIKMSRIAENMLVEVGKFTFLADLVILEMEEDYFDALLDKGSKILHSIKGTNLKEKLFAEFNEFIEMTTGENSKSESDTEEPPFE
ncbi:hypothetical protein Tco_1190524 [Tanacetum coccineum]